MHVLLTGSLAYDRIFNFHGAFKDVIIPEKLDSFNTSFYAPTMSESFGGCAGNMAYNLALLGDEPELFGLVGRDIEPYQSWLEKNNISTKRLLKRPDSLTTIAIMVTDKTGNQFSIFSLGASAEPYPYADLKGDFCIVAPGNQTDMVSVPKLCKEAGIPYMYDPGQQIPVLSGEEHRDSMQGAKVFISNDYELALIQQKTGWSEADILERVEILITTLGEKGSVIKTKSSVVEIPSAKPKNSDDPTGAGDAYRAGFVHGLLRGWPLATAGRLGGLVAVYTVEAVGTQTHHFTSDDLTLRYRENFNQELPN